MRIVVGLTSRTKVVEIEGVPQEASSGFMTSAGSSFSQERLRTTSKVISSCCGQVPQNRVRSRRTQSAIAGASRSVMAIRGTKEALFLICIAFRILCLSNAIRIQKKTLGGIQARCVTG